MQDQENTIYKNISIHISDRLHYNLTMNVYDCGNRNIESERLKKTDQYILFFVKEGKGYVTERQATHKIKAGQGFVIFPDEEVSVKSERDKVMNVTWIAFSGYLVANYLGRAKITPFEPVYEDNAEKEAEGLFDHLLAVSTTFPNRYCKIMAQLYGIFSFLLDNVRKAPLAEAATPELYLIKALDFIDVNYMKGISVEDVAADAGITRKALYGIFKKLTGFSPKDYLIYYRMSKASTLLLEENLSIEGVAASVGYSDQFHFSKEFKKNVGLSPSVYRKEVLLDSTKLYNAPIDTIRQQYEDIAYVEHPPKINE